MKHSAFRAIGVVLVLTGILFSPVKAFTLRCYSNPAHWLEEKCEQFRQFHTPWGYAILIAGILVIAFSFLRQRRDHKNDV